MHYKILKQINYGVPQFFFLIITLKLCLINKSYSITLKINQISITKFNPNKISHNSHLRNLSEQNVYGSAFKINYYYSNLYLGEKMQKQGYILDTGSTITTATCSPICKHCGLHISPHYEVENIEKKIILCSDPLCNQVSSKCHASSHPKECSFVISYSEGSSLSGTYINEIVRFGKNYQNQTGYKVPIGCTTDENHLFYTQDANGIMGLANNENNFVEMLYKNGAIKNNLFSLCFGQLGGIFNIGEINNKTHIENMTYVPMLLDRGKYFGVSILTISVNNHTLQNYEQYNHNIFIDSGTTICYIQDKIFEEILTLTKQECAKYLSHNPCGEYEYHSDYGHCFYFKTTEELDYAVYNYWPTIHFYLNNYDYKWRPKYYVFNITTNKRPGACMGINKYSGTKITLGSSWIIGHDIVFDRKNKLLGFAEADCGLNENINMTNGLELVDDDYRLKISNMSFNKSKYGNISYYNEGNKLNIENQDELYKNIIIYQYIIIAIFSFTFFTVIVLILYFKYLKKSDMTRMNIENENVNNNIADINNKNENEKDKKKDSYKKISTEVDPKEIKDNKDNQSIIVIET